MGVGCILYRNCISRPTEVDSLGGLIFVCSLCMDSMEKAPYTRTRKCKYGVRNETEHGNVSSQKHYESPKLAIRCKMEFSDIVVIGSVGRSNFGKDAGGRLSD